MQSTTNEAEPTNLDGESNGPLVHGQPLSVTIKNVVNWSIKHSLFTAPAFVGIVQFFLIWWLRYNRGVGAKLWMITLQGIFTIGVFVIAAHFRWKREVSETLQELSQQLKIPYNHLTSRTIGRLRVRKAKTRAAFNRQKKKSKKSEESEDQNEKSLLLEQLIIEGSTIRNFLFLYNLLLASVALCIEVAFFMRFRVGLEFDTYSALVTIPLTFLIAGSVPYYLELFKRITAEEKNLDLRLSKMNNALYEYERNVEPVWQFYKNSISDKWASTFQEVLYQFDFDAGTKSSGEGNLSFREFVQTEINVYGNAVFNQKLLSEPKPINGAKNISFVTKSKRDELAYIMAANAIFIEETNLSERFEKSKSNFLRRFEKNKPYLDERITGHRLDTWINNYTLCRVEAQKDGQIYPEQAAARIFLATDFRSKEETETSIRETVSNQIEYFLWNEIEIIKSNAAHGCVGCHELVMFLNNFFGTEKGIKEAIRYSSDKSDLKEFQMKEDVNIQLEDVKPQSIAINLRDILINQNERQVLTTVFTKFEQSTECIDPSVSNQTAKPLNRIPSSLKRFRILLQDCDDYCSRSLGTEDYDNQTRFHTWLFPTDERIHYIVLNRIRKWSASPRIKEARQLLDHRVFAENCHTGTSRHIQALPDRMKMVKESCDELGLNYQSFTEDSELFNDLLGRYSNASLFEDENNFKSKELLEESLLIRNLVYALVFGFASERDSVLSPARIQSLHRYISLWRSIESQRLNHLSENGIERTSNVIPNGNAAQNLRQFWCDLRDTLEEIVYHHRQSSAFLVQSEDQSLELAVLELTHHRGPLQNWIKASNSVNRRHEFQKLKFEIDQVMKNGQNSRILGLPVLPSQQLVGRVLKLACEIPEDSYQLKVKEPTFAAPVRLSVVPLSAIELWDIEDLNERLKK